MSTVLLKRHEQIGVVELNRPARLNAISTGLCIDLHEVLQQVALDKNIRVIVLCGAGRAFCAGDDLKEFDQQTANPAATRKHIESIQKITRDMMFMDKLVIGAVQGYAVGGGFEWMLNCDMVVAGEDLIAFFPEMEWGQFVTGGVTHLLPQAIGYQQAMELLVLGERQTAQGLKSRGLVNWVVPVSEVMERAIDVANRAAAKSAFSTGALKRLMTRGISADLGRALDLEEEITIASFATEEARARSENFPVGEAASTSSSQGKG